MKKYRSQTKAFTDVWTTEQDEDEYLKRVPKEFDGNHAYPDDLRLKSFIAGAKLTQKQVTSDGFADELGKMFKKGSALTEFLSKATGVAY